MSKITVFFYKLISCFMIIMLIVMVGSIMFNVIARYFGKAVMWVDEISRLSFVWMSFLAIIIGFHYNMHPSFKVLHEKIKRNTVKKILLTTIHTLVLCFLIYVLKGGIDYTAKSYLQKTAILGISVGWKYSAVPFSAFIMALEAFCKIVLVWKSSKLAGLNS